MILNQYKSEPNHWNHQTKNPKPFTSLKVKDPKDEEYWTLTAGMYQEVFEPKPKESYGHFTLNTTTQHINSIDTHNLKGFIIDPVAFAYDFGARMYDARIGRWLSVDPLDAKYPFINPYTFAANKPIMFIDYDGRDIIPSNQFKASAYYKVVLNMVDNLKVLPTANKYLAPFLVAGKDLRLTYHSLSGRAGATMSYQESEKYLAVTSNEARRAGFEAITFNADAAFKIKTDKNEQPVRQNGDETVGHYVSEMGMANTVVHEAMHANVMSHELMASPKMRAEMKSAMLDYAKLQGIKLSDQEAEALSWNGLRKTEAWKKLSLAERTKISSTIEKVVYGNESTESTDEHTDRMKNQESLETMTDEKIKPTKP